MNILFAPGHYLFSDRYGSEPLWAVELVDALSKEANSVDVIVGVADLERKLPNNITVHAIFKTRSKNAVTEFVRRSAFYFLVTLKALHLLFKNKYDVVHHLLPFSLATFNPIIFLIKFFNKNTKIVLGPIQAPYESANLNDLDIALIGRKANPLISRLLQLVYLIMVNLMKWMSIIMLKSVDFVVCTSDMSWKYYSKFTSVSHSIIPPFIGVFDSKKRPISYSNTILCVAALVSRKGHKYLLDALELLNLNQDTKLIIVGDGPERKALEGLARSKGLSKKIEFVGNLPREDVMLFYSKSTVLCLPSLEDSYPTVLIEAMAHGLPIVATDVGSAREMIETCGYVVPKEDPQALAKALEKVISNKKVRQDLASNALERYEKFYSKMSIVGKYMLLYGKNPQ